MEKVEVNAKLVAIKLGDCIHVDNSVFTNAKLEERGEATAQFMKLGGDIKFVKDFKDFTNYRQIAADLKAGKDVSTQLAFNGIETEKDYLKAWADYQKAITPLIDKLEMLIPPYPFATKPEGVTNTINFGPLSVSKKSYKMKIERAKEIWNKASQYWVGNKATPASHYISNGSGNYVHYTMSEIAIGCQSFPRWEVEEMAQHYGWSFPAPK